MAITAWGIRSKNKEQEEALKALLDPSIDMVILEGKAGSGKTLLALAAGLDQILESRMYKQAIFTRNAVSVGENLGYLPGELEEKMLPWCGALVDNLEELIGNDDSTNSFIGKKIKIIPTQHMRGRSFKERYIIVDEVQNLTSHEIKVLISRVGEDSKLVLLGDISQIDNKKLNKSNNGLTYVLDRVTINDEFIKIINLQQCERSRLSSWAGDKL